MYFEIEPTGCCEYKGMVQVKYRFYLDPADHGYEKHYVDVRVLPDEMPKKFRGDLFGDEKLRVEYLDWVSSLPVKKQLNPFHSHIMLFPSTVTDKEINDMGASFLSEAYEFWSRGVYPALKGVALDKSAVVPVAQKESCMERVSQIATLSKVEAVKYGRY
jgi:hypothetical protein